MDKRSIQQELNEELLNSYLEKKELGKLKEQISKYNPVDIKEYIEDLDTKNMLLVYRLLSKDDAIEVFTEMDLDEQKVLLHAFTDKEMVEIIDELYFDDYIDLLEEMPAGVVKKILRESDENKRNMINRFLSYPEDSAGSLMTIEFVELKPYQTVEEALNIIKKTGVDKVTVYTCYVADEKKTLLGFVSLRKIVTSEPDTKISDLMIEDIIYVNTDDDQEYVADMFKKYGFVVIPVVDNEKRLVGIITVDDIMEVMEQEATEDFQKIAGTLPEDESYMDLSALRLAKNRLPWLLILMISGALSATVLKRYEDVIQAVIALNMFIPMLTDSGGNAGSQASTLVIRAMATGEIELKDWPKVIWKECRIGIIAGLVMGIVTFMKCFLFDKVSATVAITVSMTIFCIVLIAKVIGAGLPMLAKKLGFDPAIMASPLITTVVDTLGLLTYFEVAKIILKI
ncbi:MAG: magnesium transporter [Finegoldia sp.]|nr:magnesium transporter [Finegoldia sp.]